MEFFLVLDVIRNVLLAPPYEDPEMAMREGRESFSGLWLGWGVYCCDFMLLPITSGCF